MKPNTWTPPPEPDIPLPDSRGWLRVIRRAIPMIVLILAGLLVMLLLRLVERPAFGEKRPWTPHITVAVCRALLWVMGIRYQRQGQVTSHPGALVANHSSWLDIFTLNAAAPLYFVSKAEVAGWPGIGWLARATGTMFIERDPRQAKAQTNALQSRLSVGHKLLFFPEGTSTDGLSVIPFKSTLFASFFADKVRDHIWVQPVSVRYCPPAGTTSRHYGWWGDMDLAPHLLRTLATQRQGQIKVIYHDPVRVVGYASRKDLAAYCETQVRIGHHSLNPD
ncbi:MAG: lysophospholipid acyltransferase family protein [Paracoccaceae bacterium]